MTPEECRREGARTVKDITTAIDRGFTPSPIETSGSAAQALWEIAAQLSEITTPRKAVPVRVATPHSVYADIQSLMQRGKEMVAIQDLQKAAALVGAVIDTRAEFIDPRG